VLVYHLPALTGVQLPDDTWLAIADIPNIVGAKLSGCASMVRRLAPRWPDGFRAIIAEPLMADQLFRAGVPEHLDGLWALAPELAVKIDHCCEKGRFDEAAKAQDRINQVHRLLVEFGVFEAATAILNARGVPGRMAPSPIGRLAPDRAEELLRRMAT
jgi:dihydrodipicolinate synthase/N-acetylneuraminate lyase